MWTKARIHETAAVVFRVQHDFNWNFTCQNKKSGNTYKWVFMEKKAEVSAAVLKDDRMNVKARIEPAPSLIVLKRLTETFVALRRLIRPRKNTS